MTTVRINVYSGYEESVGLTEQSWSFAVLVAFPKSFHAKSTIVHDQRRWVLLHSAELIAAANWEQSAIARIGISFTRILIDELRELDGEATTLAHIYARVFRFAQQNQIGPAPIYIPKAGLLSVTIGRGRATERRARSITRSNDRESYRVLLNVKVRGDFLPDLTQWEEWLTRNSPVCVLSAEVTVEGACRGSSLPLFSVPAEVRTMMLAGDPADTFIEHVTCV
ncbi:hypothetical protein N7539_007570 [Penicillium diatomitis]|uniref:Uncharacterized protein n=1 Tax=Penicillium diatomitis TaxID=2819901 RepID=A0A9X0BPG8_9EURO|nr:uncharacterized protein N7539_007570 [Penicillium diatomitis]KAJ5477426.1 hypothetical protein N7539_007570 [Penicillium diatomitis]